MLVKQDVYDFNVTVTVDGHSVEIESVIVQQFKDQDHYTVVVAYYSDLDCVGHTSAFSIAVGQLLGVDVVYAGAAFEANGYATYTATELPALDAFVTYNGQTKIQIGNASTVKVKYST